eukprot:5598576-Pyramimonas_sp.AAC.1
MQNMKQVTCVPERAKKSWRQSSVSQGTCVCASAPADDDGFNNCRDRTLKRLLRYGMIRVF